MRTYYYTFSILICIILEINGIVQAQSYDRNFVRKSVALDTLNSSKKETLRYVDGLGREVEIVKRKFANNKDCVTHAVYDCNNNVTEEWIPTAIESNDGNFISPERFKEKAIASHADEMPFYEYWYESSPVKRLVYWYRPGINQYVDGISITDYLNNSRQWKSLIFNSYEGESFDWVMNRGTALKKSLLVTLKTEKDAGSSYVCKNVFGQQIALRQTTQNGYIDTYFVYNRGNLIYVLPPIASDLLSQKDDFWEESEDLIKKYAYSYKYDQRNRCIQKRIPGTEPVLFKYDKADRLIFKQDGNMRAKGKWYFTLYDVFNREVITGTCTSVVDVGGVKLDAVPCLPERGFHNTGYRVEGFDPESVEILSINYYDRYDFVDLIFSRYRARFKYDPEGANDSIHICKGAPEASAMGCLTGQFTRLNSIELLGMGRKSFYYDFKGNIIQDNEADKGYIHRNCYKYTFTNNIAEHTVIHRPIISSYKYFLENYKYWYDQDRPIKVEYTLNDTVDKKEVKFAWENNYDDLGHLQSQTFLQNNRCFTYGYDLHERLTNVIGPNFEQKLGYSYCGDIISMEWKANSNKRQGYFFSYDGIRRLTSARYREEGRESNHYNCSYTYDKQGNITSLVRNGLKNDNTFGKIDDLSFRYDANQLMAIDDAAEDPLSYGSFNFRDGNKSGESEYGYDANGNLTFDKNAGIAHVTYNLFNQPERIQYTNGNTINYTYDGLGKKHMVSYLTAISGITVPFGSRFDLLSNQRSALLTTIYYGNIIYNNNTGVYDENDPFIVTNQIGYCDENAAGDFVQHYYERDHQGNNRIVVSDQVEEVNHYYPYGGLFAESVSNGDNLFRYNGKEHYKMFGLGWYDYGARLYDPSTIRFISIDPLCEKYYSISPYVYCLNNPVRFIDPTGMKIEEGSLREWQRQRQNIERRKAELQSSVDKLTAKASAKGWSVEKLINKVGNKIGRIYNLNTTLGTMNTLENSSQVYRLSGTTGSIGGLKLSTTDNVLVIDYSGTANFVHEITHAGQFEVGDVAFDSKSGLSLAQDIFDETSAYRAQFAYSPSSVSGLASPLINGSYNIIPQWVQGLGGGTLYSPGGSANTGIIPLNINSTNVDFIIAYPNNPSLKNLPDNFILKQSYPSIYYKR